MDWVMQHPVKAGLDLLSLLTIAASWTGYITPIATVLGGVWCAIQIIEWFYKKLNRDR